MRYAPLTTLIITSLAWAGLTAPTQAAHVNVIELDNKIISPITQQYIVSAIQRSEQDAAVCLIIKLDTPGGLLESTRGIVKAIMNAKVPVAVYVAPMGSRAGSAGVFITLAAHVAAMAPSTNIGAAHPIAIGQGKSPMKRLIRRFRPDDDDEEETEEIVEEASDPMTDKIMNDTIAWITTIARTRNRNTDWAKQAVQKSVSATEREALEQNIVDLIARDVPDLLRQMDGRTVTLIDTPVELATAGASIVEIPMSRRQQFLAVVTNPNVAYLLMMLGTFGLIFEFTHPGIGFPGIAGLICVLLAMYAFQTLPISYAGLALLVLGLGLLIAEVTVISGGLLALGGVIALTLGSLMLFESPNPNLQVSLGVIVPTVVILSGIIFLLVQKALRAQTQKVTTGAAGLLGAVGKAATDLSPEGQVFVHGEFWQATSTHSVAKGTKVRVMKVDGIHLLVDALNEKTDAGAKPGRQRKRRRRS